MAAQTPLISTLILENRQMIATILADLLEEAGYRPCLFSEVGQMQQSLLQHLPAILLIDVGMIREKQQAQWEMLQDMANSLDLPIIHFACSHLPDQEDLLMLRSPSDFTMVIERLERVRQQKQPFLGVTLVQMNLLSSEALEIALHLQKELARIGRQHTLGDLLIRLDMVTPEGLEDALRRQER